MKLYALRIFTSDLDSARHFYGETLGLPQLWDSGDAVGFDVGTTLIVEQEAGDEPDLVGRFSGLSLQVADMDHTVATLSSKGLRFLGPPERQAWGGRLVHFSDPDENVLTLVEIGQ